MLEKTSKYLDKNYINFKDKLIYGRYIALENIEPIIINLPNLFKVQKLGCSLKNKSIFKIELGSGKIKILCWSQMHGNESTGTKAMFDLFQFFKKPLELKDLRDFILKECTLVFIPMLNPDGAKVYTRLNTQDIDLNRDAIDLKAPESKLLRSVVNSFQPDYCFNLHDQRTIFSVGELNNPATLSFLAPSVNERRDITCNRKDTMKVIAGIYTSLNELIPNQIGRYTDAFYPTATGDNFQKEGYNTILIEAGHFKDDYEREITRKYNFIALLIGLEQITLDNKVTYKTYFEIPNNHKNYLDILYKNIQINNETYLYGVTYKEELQQNKVVFIPVPKKLEEDSNYNANKIVLNSLKFNNENEFVDFLLVNEQFSM